MSEECECPVPPEAFSDPNSREILRVWIAKEGLHVSLMLPDEWNDPGHWGAVLCDVICHLGSAYENSQGINPQLAMCRIQQTLSAELGTGPDVAPGSVAPE